jgi:hypothetical protein
MDCLKCPNYWGDTPNEQMCEHCANSKELCDVVREMPPLFVRNKAVAQVCHLK